MKSQKGNTSVLLEQIEKNLPEEEKHLLLSLGAILRLPDLENRLTLAKAKIQKFEKKYKTTLAKIEKKGLPENANHIEHEEFIEWKHWSRVVEECRRKIN